MGSKCNISRFRDPQNVHSCAKQRFWCTDRNKKLRYREEHSASDFDTSRKLICYFILVINTNLHSILHRFQVMAHYWSHFS